MFELAVFPNKMTNGKCCRVKMGEELFFIHDYITLLRPKLWCWRGNMSFFPLLSEVHIFLSTYESYEVLPRYLERYAGTGWRVKEEGMGGLVERWIKREATQEAERKLGETVLILPPVGQLGSIQVQSGAGKTKPSSANHLHLECLSAPVTHPVSVTNSNKHPNLITQLPLHPTASKENL